MVEAKKVFDRAYLKTKAFCEDPSFKDNNGYQLNIIQVSGHGITHQGDSYQIVPPPLTSLEKKAKDKKPKSAQSFVK